MMTAKSLLPLLLLAAIEKASAATCYPGTYTASCIPCPTGTFSSIGGAAACIQCPEGSDSPPGAAACLTRCGWVDAAAADVPSSMFAMTSHTNVVCPPDHYCPDIDVAVASVDVATAAA